MSAEAEVGLMLAVADFFEREVAAGRVTYDAATDCYVQVEVGGGPR